MKLDTYQQRARLTAIYMDSVRLIENPEMLLRLSYIGLGLAGEVGEFNNKLKKLIRDNHGTLDEEIRLALARELGDVLWYVGQAAYEIGYRLEEIATMNLDTLESRKERNQIKGSGDER